MREEVGKKPDMQGRDLGKISKLEVQIVDGLNFRITFVNEESEITQVVVYDQPWTKTRQLKSYKVFS